MKVGPNGTGSIINYTSMGKVANNHCIRGSTDGVDGAHSVTHLRQMELADDGDDERLRVLIRYLRSSPYTIKLSKLLYMTDNLPSASTGCFNQPQISRNN